MTLQRDEDPMSDPSTAKTEYMLQAPQLQMLVEQASDGIFIADVEGRYIFVNDAGCRMLGFSRTEIIGKAIFDLIPSEDVGRLLDARTALLGGAEQMSEWQLRRKDGSWLPVEVSAKILPNGQWQGIVRDISERKARRVRDDTQLHKLDEAYRLLKSIFDIIPVGVWIADREGRIMLANRAADQIWQGTRYVGPEQLANTRRGGAKRGSRSRPMNGALSGRFEPERLHRPN